MYLLKEKFNLEKEQNKKDTPILYIWDDISLMVKRSPKKAVPHTLMINTVVINLEKDYIVAYDSIDKWHKCRSAFWPSYAKHAWRSGEVMAYAFIEPSCLHVNAIRKNMMTDHKHFLTDLRKEQKAIECFKYIYQHHPNPDIARELLLSALIAPDLSYVHSDNYKFDKRAKTIMSVIREHPELNYSIKDMAAMVNLSESRAEHLFKTEMNMPITHYRRLWRLKAASAYVKKFGSLSMAALEAGFNDLPHFSNVFKQFSGMTPSAIYSPNSEDALKIVVSKDLPIAY